MLASDPARRQLLLAAKLKGLVRGRWGDVVDAAAPGHFPSGAARHAATTAWVLAEDEPARSLGPALAWALRQGCDEVHLLAAGQASTLARRAAYFRVPVHVWRIDGTEVYPAEPSPVEPEPEAQPDAIAAVDLIAMIEQAGADVVVEHGVLRGEVRGLEVCRVVADPDGAPALQLGVGKHDREAHLLTHGDRRPTVEDLFAVVRSVLEHRVPGGEGHAAYHLAGERWLRSVVVRRPELVGAKALRTMAAAVARDDLRQPSPAPAAGEDLAGAPLVVVCSVGVDVDLVAAAADSRAADSRGARLLVCLPEGDDHRITGEVARALREPAEIVTVGTDWRSL